MKRALLLTLLLTFIATNVHTANPRISSGFGMRINPITGNWQFHPGIDIAAPVGTPVVSIADGTLAYAGWYKGYGIIVQILHDDGSVSQYGHLSGYHRNLESGARVEKGQVIGLVGSTGRSTGPHLDFRMFTNDGRYVNPEVLFGLKTTSKKALGKRKSRSVTNHFLPNRKSSGTSMIAGIATGSIE